jgi:hypothetical protein
MTDTTKAETPSEELVRLTGCDVDKAGESNPV